MYNVFFTVFPPLAMGIFDQFISARLLDRYPQLYQLGQKGQFVGFQFSLLNVFGADCRVVVQNEQLLGVVG